MNKDARVGKTAVAGTIYMGASQAAKVLISIASTIVLARLLDPSEFGVIAMVAPITGFILIFQSLGLNQAVVQSKTLTDSQTNALFWINITASAVISLAFLLFAPLIGLFYSDPRPAQVMAASAVTVLITGLSLQHTALLNRNMKFKEMSLVDVGSAVTTLVVTVIAAYLLRSFWAIWIGTLAAAAVNGLMVWSFSPWRPQRRPSFQGTRGLVAFGANITGFNLLNYASRNVDNVLIAKVWGAAAVGLYDRSYRLMMFPISNINAPLGRIMVPILSRLADQPARYRRAYLMAMQAIVIVSVPGVWAAAATSDRLILFLLGEKWAAAAPIFFWLSLAAVTQPLSNSTGWLFQSSGRSGALMRWGIYSSVITVAAFVAGLRWGPTGVAMAYFLSQVLKIPVLYQMCVKDTPITSRDLYGMMLLPGLAGIATMGLVHLLSPYIGPTSGFLALAVVISYGLNLLGQAATPTGREGMRSLVSIVQTAVADRLAKRSGLATE
jgi:PST family polysaccharide transporter